MGREQEVVRSQQLMTAEKAKTEVTSRDLPLPKQRLARGLGTTTTSKPHKGLVPMHSIKRECCKINNVRTKAKRFEAKLALEDAQMHYTRTCTNIDRPLAGCHMYCPK